MRLILVPAILALAAVGGCSGMVNTVTYEYPQTVGVARVFLQDAAAAGPVLLEVRDSPFAGDVAGPMAAAASDTSVGIRVRFTSDRTQARSDSRIVVQFSPAPGLSSIEVCDASRAVAKAPANDRITAMVAFCNRTQPILSMVAYAAKPERPEALIKTLGEQTMLRMFLPSSSLRESPSDYWPDF